MRGYRKGCSAVDGRQPVSYDLLGSLARVLPSFCFSVYEVTLFQAVFVLAFFGALRIGELVCTSTRLADGLLYADVHCSTTAVVLWIKRSKTDQIGWGSRVELFPVPGLDVCLVRMLS